MLSERAFQLLGGILVVLKAYGLGVVRMTAMIELTCAVHVEPGANGPLVTTAKGLWAYCLGGGAEDHDWRKIEPTALELLRSGPHRSETGSMTKR